MSTDTDTDTRLRALDPARAPLTDVEQRRAELLLERIVREEPVGVAAPVVELRRRRPRSRLVLLPAAAAAVGLGVLLLPGPGGSGNAYASWTPEPTSVSRADLAVVEPHCERIRESTLDGRPVEYRLAATERRGDTVGLLYRSEDPDLSSVCLVHQVAGSTRVSDVKGGTGGSSGPAQVAPPGGFTAGALSQFADPVLSVTDGAVGPGVVGVTIHAGALSVQATVEGGRYYAWWPGPAFEDVVPPSGESGPEDVLVFDLELADGTVVRDAQPALPK